MLNALFKALADPTRRQILELLKEKDLTSGEIADHFQASKPNISQHLAILKHADLVTAMKKGKYVYYSLNTTVFQEVVNWILNLRNSGEGPQ
ncbi:autorepressor SdpR family transcription factor [Heyndrickxia coagulans]|uniref:autorepressor SdpR family transcription factor n=1 Tax=Heyndrickxia TaxID=2837504 RepID=UPI001C77E8CF|nr:autorepressor SdpR family transcription factor [Heyndrickxia coagulans]QWU06132.1 autorepressor SdpR family transcription factor [Heyndrickxia coagulans]UJZ86872.1 autorepressor SdpR family transcription factor [Heyndrickxia coagulans]